MDNVSVLSVNTTEVLKRFFKYLAEGLMVAIAAYVFPKKKMDADEIITMREQEFSCPAWKTFLVPPTFVSKNRFLLPNGAAYAAQWIMTSQFFTAAVTSAKFVMTHLLTSKF